MEYWTALDDVPMGLLQAVSAHTDQVEATVRTRKGRKAIGHVEPIRRHLIWQDQFASQHDPAEKEVKRVALFVTGYIHIREQDSDQHINLFSLGFLPIKEDPTKQMNELLAKPYSPSCNLN